MQKEGLKNRRNNIIIAIITTIGIITVAFINKCNNKEENEVPFITNKHETVTENSKINKNNGTINKTDVGINNGNIYNGDPTIINESINISNNGYSIKGSLELLKCLKKSKHIIVNQNSKNIINLSFSGEIVELKEKSGIYIYNGGVIILIINGEHCNNFKEMKLDYIRANPKNIIENELRNRIDEFVVKNSTKIKNSILECI